MGMNFNNNQPIWIQIEEWVHEQILNKNWNEGDKTKSIRELAVAFEVNPNTILRAFDKLQNEEIISNKRGIGFFVTEGATEKIKRLRKQKFLEEEVPKFLKTMKLLDISFEELNQVMEQAND
ncbi:MAG: GntR family transcriptional regulator [Bacteroidales bacterium]|nr:GntR family transcriptional regulator [Bacteroidales bacterium]